MTKQTSNRYPVIFDGKGTAQTLTPAIVATADGTSSPEDNLYWHPAIPFGKFKHPLFGEFETTRADGEQMIANFNSGIPGPAGIPIDETGDHSVRGDGAYGWVKALEIRDNAVWMGIQWTDDGIAAVSSGNLPYVSPRWFGSGQEDSQYGKGNIIRAVALCTRPFFYDQPELRVATSDFTQVDDDVPTTDDSATGGSQMADLAITAREKYVIVNGDVTDDEWEKLTAGFDTDEKWTEFIASIDASTEEGEDTGGETETDETTESGDGAGDTAEVLLKRVEAAEAETKEAQAAYEKAVNDLGVKEKENEDLGARLTTLEAERDEAKAHEEIAATDLGDNKRYAPAAIDLLVKQRLNPGAESAKAIEAHMVEHGGMMATVIVGEYPSLTATGATAGDLSDDEFWAVKKAEIPEDTIAETEQLVASESIGFRAAYNRVIDGRRG